MLVKKIFQYSFSYEDLQVGSLVCLVFYNENWKKTFYIGTCYKIKCVFGGKRFYFFRKKDKSFFSVMTNSPTFLGFRVLKK